MLVLHGIYDNGKVEILEKDLPEIKAEVEIHLVKPQSKFSFKKSRKILEKYKVSLSDAVIAERRDKL